MVQLFDRKTNNGIRHFIKSKGHLMSKKICVDEDMAGHIDHKKPPVVFIIDHLVNCV